MVTMSSEKGGGGRRKTEHQLNSQQQQATTPSHEDSPNHLVYAKMEAIIERMQDETTGVPVKTVKSFMSKIPSVFTGADLITWMMKNLDVEDQGEALHLAHLFSSHGYLFPIDDHVLTVKNDNTFYRFQTPYFWPSNCWEPENTDYAVYLCKRTMQNKTRLELADYEAESLARLQKMFSRKWEFIFMQAEAQSKVDKKRDKLERKVLDSQERAFWDMHRPMPGCVNTTELDIKKACRMNKPSTSGKSGAQGGESNDQAAEKLRKDIAFLKSKLDRSNMKVSKVAESYINYFEQYTEYDPYFTPPDVANPWLSDNPEFWEQEKQAKDVAARRVKRWAFSLQELLADPVGREQFIKFLDKEFSGENLRFWEAVQELKTLPQSEVTAKVSEIWMEFLAPDASCPVNVDSHSNEITKKNMAKPDRWTFDQAAIGPTVKTISHLWSRPQCDCDHHLLANHNAPLSFLSSHFQSTFQNICTVHYQVMNKLSSALNKFISEEMSAQLNLFSIFENGMHVSKSQDKVQEHCGFLGCLLIPVFCCIMTLIITRDVTLRSKPQAHVYHLMKTDSYSRYLRSEMYKDFLQGSKKKTSMKGIRSIVSFSGRKDANS